MEVAANFAYFHISSALTVWPGGCLWVSSDTSLGPFIPEGASRCSQPSQRRIGRIEGTLVPAIRKLEVQLPTYAAFARVDGVCSCLNKHTRPGHLTPGGACQGGDPRLPSASTNCTIRRLAVMNTQYVRATRKPGGEKWGDAHIMWSHSTRPSRVSRTLPPVHRCAQFPAAWT